MKCPNCNSVKLQKKGKRDGKQRYKCTNCGASFTEGKEYIPAQKYSPLKEVTCPECGSDRVVRDGKLEDDSQRYRCKECNLRFSQKTGKKRPKNEKILKVIENILNGKNVEKVALEYNYSTEHLRKVMAPYYKKEKITQEQEDLIIKYGFRLNVPVDYLAEYIKCSEHKCKEVLKRVKKEFKGVFKSTNPCATSQSSSKTSESSFPQNLELLIFASHFS